MSVVLNDKEKEDFRERHLPHRLTLLRTFRDRDINQKGMGNVHRCLKDAALISIRLFLEAMGLNGRYDPTTDSYVLEERARERRKPDDVWIDQLGGELVNPASIPADDARVLAGIYWRASKELAHLTHTDLGEFNTPEALKHGTDLIEELIQKHLYDQVGWGKLPPRTTDD
jgi:hypothetical protein